MCRHLAYLGPSRSLSSILYEPAHSLEAQGRHPRFQLEGAVNAHGWGVGWWDAAVGPEPVRFRTERSMWTDNSFRPVAEVTHTEAFVAAVRNASPPAPIEASGNAPFTSGPWLFSLNGFVKGFRSGVGEQLVRAVTPSRAGAIEGSSDSEVLFALVLDQLDAGRAPAEALAEVMGRVLSLTDGKLNLLLCDGKEITATTYGNSLFFLAGSGLAAGGMLLASEPLDDDPGWTSVPNGSGWRGTITGQSHEPLIQGQR